MNKYWFIALLLSYVLIFSAGAYFMYEHTQAGLKSEAVKVEDRALKGQNDIIKFNTQIQKVYVKVKSPCLNESVPADVQRLLK